MFRMALSLIFMLLCSTTLQAQHKAHTHGEGSLSLAQDQYDWYVELHIPAMDLLGFEHAPKNTAQKQKFKALTDRLANSDHVIVFSPACQLTDTDIGLPGQHDEQEHQHDHHHHSDIIVQYRFTCAGDVSSTRLNIFNWATSLHQLRAQWLTEKSTASATLTPEQATIRF